MDESSSHAGDATPASRVFPGGRARLPRLAAKDRDHEPHLDLVRTGFRRPVRPVAVASDPPSSGFSRYFSYESLFEEPPAEQQIPADGEDPFKVLRIPRTAEWSTIVGAHRALVKEFHPDRFASHPDEIQDEADREIKRINAAYSKLKQVHRDGR